MMYISPSCPIVPLLTTDTIPEGAGSLEMFSAEESLMSPTAGNSISPEGIQGVAVTVPNCLVNLSLRE